MHPLSTVIVFGWIVFWLYWLISAFSSKRNAKRKINQFVYFRLAIFIFAIIIIRYINRNNATYYDLVTNNIAVETIGFIFFLTGLGLAIWARIYLGKNWGMPMSVKEDPELVMSGPYKYIRHPIYSGIALAIIGSSLASSIYWLVLLLVVPYFIYSAVNEERLMMKQFPKVYKEYKARSKMFIPLVF